MLLRMRASADWVPLSSRSLAAGGLLLLLFCCNAQRATGATPYTYEWLGATSGASDGNLNGTLAKSNAELVEKIVRISRDVGRDIASAAEARVITGLAKPASMAA